MNKHFSNNFLIFLLIFFLIFKVCTLRENVIYFYNNPSSQDRHHFLMEYEVNTGSLVFATRKVIDFQFLSDVVEPILKSFFKYFFILAIMVFIKPPIFDLRRKISKLITVYFNGSKYKDNPLAL